MHKHTHHFYAKNIFLSVLRIFLVLADLRETSLEL